jgi:hypothetical protein
MNLPMMPNALSNPIDVSTAGLSIEIVTRWDAGLAAGTPGPNPPTS